MLLDLLFVLLLSATIFKTKLITSKNTYNDDYMSIKNCSSYKGLFALIVILHHISQRVSGNIIVPDFTRVGYLAVSVFLFLSGYGLQKQNLTKPDYHKGFILKRIPQILIPYIIMSVIYWIIYALLGDVRSFSVMWHNFIVNGDPIVWYSWYVVCILYFYIAFYLLMKIFKKKRLAVSLGGTAFCILYIFICYKLRFGLWWYHTSFVFALGIMFSSYEENISNFVKKHYPITLISCLIAFVVLAKCKWLFYWLIPSTATEFLLVTFLAFLFIASFFVLSLKVYTNNKILAFLGKISFELYMTQGALMLILRNDIIRIQNDFLWSLLVLSGTVLFAYLLNKLFSLILKKYADFVAKLCKKWYD